MGIPLVIIQFTWIFRYKPSILGYPHYIIYIYTLYIYHIHRPETLHSHFKEIRFFAGARWPLESTDFFFAMPKLTISSVAWDFNHQNMAGNH